jgi:hypothetical protein
MQHEGENCFWEAVELQFETCLLHSSHHHLASRLKVGLYLYPPSVPSWSVKGRSLPLFQNNEEVEMAVGEWLRMPEPDFCRDGVFKLMTRWGKSFSVLADCVIK